MSTGKDLKQSVNLFVNLFINMFVNFTICLSDYRSKAMDSNRSSTEIRFMTLTIPTMGINTQEAIFESDIAKLYEHNQFKECHNQG